MKLMIYLSRPLSTEIAYMDQHPDSHHILKYIDYYFKYVGRELQSNSCELSNFIPSTFTSEFHAFPTNMKCFLVCLSIIEFLVFLVS